MSNQNNFDKNKGKSSMNEDLELSHLWKTHVTDAPRGRYVYRRVLVLAALFALCAFLVALAIDPDDVLWLVERVAEVLQDAANDVLDAAGV
jgi:hypothetical protein